MNNNKPVTQAGVQDLIRMFFVDLAVATGRNSERARFKGFRLMEGPRETIDKAIKLFNDGELAEALKEAQNARLWNHNLERGYCARSLSVFFDPMIKKIAHTLEEDILANIMKKYREFEILAKNMGLSHDADINAASVSYWALLSAIEKAPVEQEARERNRAERAKLKAEATEHQRLIDRRLAQEARDKVSRKAQEEADLRRREERARIALSFADMLEEAMR